MEVTDVQRYIPGAVAVPGVNVTSHPRCGDADRQRASDRIGEAYARGFLEKEEAEARRDAVARCTLAAHLEELIRDIPAMTRFKGASLPTRTQNRAQLATRWWRQHEPWASLVAVFIALMEGITPGVLTNTFDPKLAPAIVAMTVPPAVLVVIAAACSIMSWGMEL